MCFFEDLSYCDGYWVVAFHKFDIYVKIKIFLTNSKVVIKMYWILIFAFNHRYFYQDMM